MAPPTQNVSKGERKGHLYGTFRQLQNIVLCTTSRSVPGHTSMKAFPDDLQRRLENKWEGRLACNGHFNGHFNGHIWTIQWSGALLEWCGWCGLHQVTCLWGASTVLAFFMFSVTVLSHYVSFFKAGLGSTANLRISSWG